MSEYVNQKTLATYLGLSTRQVHNLVDRGMPREVKDGKPRYPLPESITWYINSKVEEALSEKGDSIADQLAERRLRAQTRTAEIQLDELEGNLIPLQEYEKRLGTIYERVSGVLRTIPSKYLSRIQVTRTDMEAQSVGEQIRDDTLTALMGAHGEEEDESGEQVA